MIIAVDYASVDGNPSPDYIELQRACKAANSVTRVAIMRGAWGTARDLTVQRDAPKALDAGLICGAYLYLRMPQLGYSASAADQVHAYADSLQGMSIVGREGKWLAPILDVEDDAGLGATATMRLVQDAWHEMVKAFGVPPIVYTSNRVWVEVLRSLPAGDLTKSPLWLAKPWPWKERTPAVLSGDSFAIGNLDPEVPAPWGPGNWWMHQYQGDAKPCPGFAKTVDLSRFRVMRQGESGRRVEWVAKRLGVATSVFGPDLMKAVRSFQMTRELYVDGIVGPQTFAALTWFKPVA